MLLKNKTAIITGCNRGIGKVILEVFAAQGADIVACTRKETRGFTIYLTEISNNTRCSITPYYFDFSNVEDVKSAVRELLSPKKRIDILVNNAMVALGSLFLMTSIKDLKSVFEVNFFSQILFSQSLSSYGQIKIGVDY
jgi:3-oxoacyl-[acyl-carrier protein] reductase